MRMIKKIVALLFVVSIILPSAGCQSEQDEIYSRLMAQVPSDDEPSAGDSQDALEDFTLLEGDSLSGELTIKTFRVRDENDSMYCLTKEFMKLHPNVTINIADSGVTGLNAFYMSDAEYEIIRESAFAEISMELASGEADYLLYDVGSWLNIPQLTRSGLLVDFHQFWDKNPELDTDIYFTDVLKSFEVDGQLTTLPYSFMFYLMYLDREILEELEIAPESLENVDANKILDWYERARETHTDLNLFFSAPGKDMLYYYLERCRYMDLENQTASFDSPEGIEFLTRTNNALNEEPDLDQDAPGGWDYGGFMDSNIRYRKTGKYTERIFYGDFGRAEEAIKTVIKDIRPGFCVLENSFTPSLITMQQPKEYVAGPYPLTTSDGKLGVHSVEAFCLPASMKNPELAWEFIKYCLSTRDMEHLNYMDLGSPAEYTYRIPLNKITFQNMLENISLNGDHGLSRGYGDFKTVDQEGMTETIDRILDRPIVNIDLYSVDMDDILQEFYVNGLTTAQQCAEKLQDRATIWLNE